MSETKRVVVGASFAVMMVTGVAHAGPREVGRGAGAHQPRRHHARMAAELGMIFGAGNRWYWRDNGKANEVDWQLPWGAGALEAKLGGGGWRFDGNAYDINALGHPGFGMLTHFLARENGYGIGESFAISSFASTTWEVGLEWAEYGSLNDMAVTSTAGVPLGETAYQMIEHARDVDVEVHGGAGVENGAAFATTGVSASLDRVPTRGTGRFRGGRRVAFAVEVPTDGLGVRAYEGSAKTTIGGYYRNREASQLVGAVNATFRYRKQAERRERTWDLLTAVGVGPSVDYRVRQRDVTVAVGADLDVDFALLRSQAFDAWRARHPDEVIRNTMTDRARPYYFAMGASIDPRVDVAYRRYVAGAKISGRLFSSFDGADRDQEQVTTDVHFTDREAAAEARLGYASGGVSLMLDGRLHRRDGRANDLVDAAGARTAMVTVGVRR